MQVGVQTFRLMLPGVDSLKGKRMVVKSLKTRMRQKFNVSVSETGLHDLHQAAEITVAVVAEDRGSVDRILDHLDQFVESDGRALIQRVEREFR